MANPIKLAINRQDGTLVSWLGSVTKVPDLYQTNAARAFQVQIVDPDPTRIGGYTAIDQNGNGLRMAIGDTPTGTSGGPAPLTLQDTWVWDPVNKWFTGNLALNTTQIDGFIGSLASKQAYFEVNLVEATGRTTLIQQTINLRAVVDEGSSTAPAPTDQYFTKAEVLALFQQLVGPKGQRLVLRSPSGAYGLEIGCADDGTAVQNVIPNP